MGTGQTELLAEELRQRPARLDGRAAGRAVHDDVDGQLVGHAPASVFACELPAAAAAAASRSTRPASRPATWRRYAAVACRSLLGSSSPRAASTAAAIASAVGAFPTRRASAAAAC